VSAQGGELEAMLRRALAPVDPPASLAERLEDTLQELTDLAVEELEGWELGAMRDPRNWGRPLAAVAVATTAGTALVLLRLRLRARRRPRGARRRLEGVGRRAIDVARR
jgi:hypothetical protein